MTASTDNTRGWVVLATDTGVGKTVVACALARLLRERGLSARVRKPVETGCERRGDERLPADGIALHAAAGGREPLGTVCPIRYLTPVAAPEAARREGESLEFGRDLAPLLDDALAGLAAGERTIIESAGGLLSPLAEDALNTRLAEHTGLPALLVTPDRLGTLSSTLSAVESLQRRGIRLAAIVLNRRPVDPTDADTPDNQRALADWLPRLVDQPPVVLPFDGRPHQLAALLA